MMPNREYLNELYYSRASLVDAGIQMVSGELAARRLKPLCTYNYLKKDFPTVYGRIPEIDVLAALNGDSDMLQLWFLGFTLSLSRN